MVQEEKHLLKVADGRVESPERDVNKGKWEMIQLLPYILNEGRDVEFNLSAKNHSDSLSLVPSKSVLDVFCNLSQAYKCLFACEM